MRCLRQTDLPAMHADFRISLFGILQRQGGSGAHRGALLREPEARGRGEVLAQGGPDWDGDRAGVHSVRRPVGVLLILRVASERYVFCKVSGPVLRGTVFSLWQGPSHRAS